MRPDPHLPIIDLPLWRNKYCELLNEDFSLFRKAIIQVCLPDEACDENLFSDTDVGVMFVSEHNSLQLTTMRWPLSRNQLEGGELLSNIVILCSTATQNTSFDYSGLQGVPQIPTSLFLGEFCPKISLLDRSSKLRPWMMRIERLVPKGAARVGAVKHRRSLRKFFVASSTLIPLR